MIKTWLAHRKLLIYLAPLKESRSSKETLAIKTPLHKSKLDLWRGHHCLDYAVIYNVLRASLCACSKPCSHQTRSSSKSFWVWAQLLWIACSSKSIHLSLCFMKVMSWLLMSNRRKMKKNLEKAQTKSLCLTSSGASSRPKVANSSIAQTQGLHWRSIKRDR